jgi:hypothetical protein
MATRSFLTCYVTRIYVMTDIGFPPITGTSSSCSFMIIPDDLSYMNFFRLGTSFSLNGVQIPKLSSSNFVCPLAPVVDISRISISIRTISLFLASSYFFLCSSSLFFSVVSFAALCDASTILFFVVIFSSASSWETTYVVASDLA